jgi:hypothetical protein
MDRKLLRKIIMPLFWQPKCVLTLMTILCILDFYGAGKAVCQCSWSKGISVMKSKQQSPCSNCMHQLVTSWGNACSTCIHQPVTSHSDACTNCMGSKVPSLSQIYLYSCYFGCVQGSGYECGCGSGAGGETAMT